MFLNISISLYEKNFNIFYCGSVTLVTLVTLVCWLFSASDLLFLTAFADGTAPAECGRSQKKGTIRGRALAPPLMVPLF